MKGSDDGGSKLVYGNEVEMVFDEVVLISYIVSNKVRLFNFLIFKRG